MVLNNNELNAEILRKAFEGADLGVVCVRGEGFIKSDDDNLCYLFGFDDGFECFVYEVLYFKEENMDVYHTMVTRRRFEIINAIYRRWLVLKPHKYHTASPFANREFVAYVTERGITKSDYVLISRTVY